MRPYEIAVIFDAGLDENDIKATTDRVSEIVQSANGSVSGIERWGRRPFAYELKHRSEGIYLFVDVIATPEAIAEVDRFLSLSDEVLRHRVIRRPDKIAGQAPAPETTPKS
ncbi:MAG: 30S ribosomal protein S6 [Acidimicrobiales bacterium]